MSPQPADSPLDAAQAARRFGVSRAQMKRWLAWWFARGVAGIRRERSPGRRGFRYRVDPGLYDRWVACELPLTRGLRRQKRAA